MAAAAAFAAAVLPKCPACLAAYLALAGLGTGAARVGAGALRVSALVACAVVPFAAALSWRRARRRPAACCASRLDGR